MAQSSEENRPVFVSDENKAIERMRDKARVNEKFALLAAKNEGYKKAQAEYAEKVPRNQIDLVDKDQVIADLMAKYEAAKVKYKAAKAKCEEEIAKCEAANAIMRDTIAELSKIQADTSHCLKE